VPNDADLVRSYLGLPTLFPIWPDEGWLLLSYTIWYGLAAGLPVAALLFRQLLRRITDRTGTPPMSA